LIDEGHTMDSEEIPRRGSTFLAPIQAHGTHDKGLSYTRCRNT
jgi:hypothetical protein